MGNLKDEKSGKQEVRDSSYPEMELANDLNTTASKSNGNVSDDENEPKPTP